MTEVLLDGLVAVPFAFAVVVALVGGSAARAGTAVAVALLGSLVTLALSVAAAAHAGSTGAEVDHVWLAALDVRWHLLLDGISAPLVLLTTLVTACCVLALGRHAPEEESRGPLAALLLLIEAGVLGAFLAVDMVLFFVFFEVALIPMWFVIHRWGDAHDEPGRRRAAVRFLVFTVLGSALMLVGFVLARSTTGTFDITALAVEPPTGGTALAAALLVALGLAVKTPLWPLHIWLPDAHSNAPTVGSMVLAALLLKLGTYGFVRFWLPIASGADSAGLYATLAALAVVGIVYGSLACLAQTELKRLIAYSSVGHMGFVVLAVATGTVGGVQAAVYASVAHGLVTGLLFFLAGAVKDRYGTGDLASLQALYGSVPRLAGLTAFAAMASLGLPGLAGFWGEVLAIRAAFEADPSLPEGTFVVLGVIAAFGVILTSAYFLQLIRTMLQGEASRREPLTDVTASEWVAWLPLVVLTVVLGVAPGLLLTPVAEATAVFLPGGGR